MVASEILRVARRGNSAVVTRSVSEAPEYRLSHSHGVSASLKRPIYTDVNVHLMFSVSYSL